MEKPWCHELRWAQTDAYAGKLLHVTASHRLSLQLHHEKDETSYVLSGRLRLKRGTSTEALHEEEVGPGFAWRVEPGVVHSIEAIEDSVVVEVSTPKLEDVVRLEDRYGRPIVTTQLASIGLTQLAWSDAWRSDLRPDIRLKRALPDAARLRVDVATTRAVSRDVTERGIDLPTL